MTSALHTSALTSLPLLARGKVRDNYAVGDDRILMVASDRISAFDVIMGQPIPGKGELLTKMALWWFDQLGPQGLNLCPIHLTGEAPESVVLPSEVPQVAGRSMLVRRLKPILVEAVVRGYLAGSGWKEYLRDGTVCGIKLPAGLQESSELPAPIFTPATKAESGHDENISFAEAARRVGADLAEQARAASLRIYTEARAYARQRGIIIADTKFEFGIDEENGGRLTLIDEALTPDSSRFWPMDTYAPGTSPPSFDKQFVRDYLETLDWNKTAPGPKLPAHVIQHTSEKYAEALRRLTE